MRWWDSREHSNHVLDLDCHDIHLDHCILVHGPYDRNYLDDFAPDDCNQRCYIHSIYRIHRWRHQYSRYVAG